MICRGRPQDPASAEAGELEPLTILIVDDEPDMRLYLRSCLRRLGMNVGRVLEAADGLEALPLLRSSNVDLLITDVVLPRLDGHGLWRAIKEDPALQHVPVLVISGQYGLPTAELGGDGFLAKPFNAHQLKAALEPLMLRLPSYPPGPRAEPMIGPGNQTTEKEEPQC